MTADLIFGPAQNHSQKWEQKYKKTISLGVTACLRVLGNKEIKGKITQDLISLLMEVGYITPGKKVNIIATRYKSGKSLSR